MNRNKFIRNVIIAFVIIGGVFWISLVKNEDRKREIAVKHILNEENLTSKTLLKYKKPKTELGEYYLPQFFETYNHDVIMAWNEKGKKLHRHDMIKMERSSFNDEGIECDVAECECITITIRWQEADLLRGRIYKKQNHSGILLDGFFIPLFTFVQFPPWKGGPLDGKPPFPRGEAKRGDN